MTVIHFNLRSEAAFAVAAEFKMSSNVDDFFSVVVNICFCDLKMCALQTES